VISSPTVCFPPTTGRGIVRKIMNGCHLRSDGHEGLRFAGNCRSGRTAGQPALIRGKHEQNLNAEVSLRFWSRRAARPPARPPWRRRVAPAASRRAHRPPSARRQRGDARQRRHQTRPPRHGAPRRGGGRSAGPLAPTHRRRPPRVPPPTGPASARGTLRSRRRSCPR